MVVMPIGLGEVVAELAVADRLRLQRHVDARLVERDGIERGEHADVGQDRRVIFAVTVAVRRDVTRDADVEAWAILTDGLRVLRHAAVEDVGGVPDLVVERVERTRADAAAAALAKLLVDDRLVLNVGNRVRAAFLRAATTAAAKLLMHADLARRMLLHLARAAAAAHADVLDRAAETRLLVPLEVREADEDVGVHDGAADLRRLQHAGVLDRHFQLVRAAQTVADDDLTARRRRVEAVDVRAVEMLGRMAAAAWIERVAVRQERNALFLLYEVGDGLRVLRAKEREVAEFAEVHLDGDEAALKLDRLEAHRKTQTLQLLRQARADVRAEIGEINFCFLCHGIAPFSFADTFFLTGRIPLNLL